MPLEFDTEWEGDSDDEIDRSANVGGRFWGKRKSCDLTELMPSIALPPDIQALIGKETAEQFQSLLTPQEEDDFVAKALTSKWDPSGSTLKRRLGRPPLSSSLASTVDENRNRRIESRSIDKFKEDTSHKTTDDRQSNYPTIGCQVVTPYGRGTVCQPKNGFRADGIIEVSTIN